MSPASTLASMRSIFGITSLRSRDWRSAWKSGSTSWSSPKSQTKLVSLLSILGSKKVSSRAWTTCSSWKKRWRSSSTPLSNCSWTGSRLLCRQPRIRIWSIICSVRARWPTRLRSIELVAAEVVNSCTASLIATSALWPHPFYPRSKTSLSRATSPTAFRTSREGNRLSHPTQHRSLALS